MAVKEVDVHLDLAEILMRELAEFEIDEYIRSQQPFIEHEFDEEVFLVERNPLLPRFKKEALTQLKRKVFNEGHDGRLKIGLGVVGPFTPARETPTRRGL